VSLLASACTRIVIPRIHDPFWRAPGSGASLARKRLKRARQSGEIGE
jgi:hypothetical protein